MGELWAGRTACMDAYAALQHPWCIWIIKCSSKFKVLDPNPADILVLMWLPPYQDQGKMAPYVTDIATDCHTSSRCHVATVTILLQDLHHFIALLITSEPNNRITNHGFIWFLLGVSCLHVLRQLLLPWCGRDQQLIPSSRWSQETAVRRQCRVLVGGAAQGRGRGRTRASFLHRDGGWSVNNVFRVTIITTVPLLATISAISTISNNKDLITSRLPENRRKNIFLLPTSPLYQIYLI